MLYRVVSAFVLLVAVSACTVAADQPRTASLSATAVGTTCTGFAGMPVPNCDFSEPPAR
jgi:hypothetical protein